LEIHLENLGYVYMNSKPSTCSPQCVPSDRETTAWIRTASTKPPGEFYEQIIRAIYTAILQPGDLAIDCGAHHGLHTIPMSDLVGSSGRVLAIEAIPELAERLALRAKGNGHTNIEVVPEAIGSREGRATFSLVKDEPGYSGLRLRDDLPSGLETSVATIEVTVTTLDGLLANSRHRVRLVKMDLEGGEYHALQGAASMLKDHRPLVILEHGGEHAAKWYGYTRDDWFALFERADLVVFDLFGRPLLPEHWRFNIPWYCIAAARGSDDEKFVRSDLRELIRTAHGKWRRERFNRVGRLIRHPIRTCGPRFNRVKQWIKQRVRSA
jgi:FkbM family methyltransferase